VFNYPLEGWADAVVMNLLMGRAVAVQLAEFSLISYQPLAEVFRALAPIEARHAELAEEGLERLIEEAGTDDLQTSVDYWWPRVAASFGSEDSAKFEELKALGLRRTPNGELKTRWQAEAGARLARLGLTQPS
jgi:ring-1,2-phenylacetyl-CoA epoxidase subunit PaaA